MIDFVWLIVYLWKDKDGDDIAETMAIYRPDQEEEAKAKLKNCRSYANQPGRYRLWKWDLPDGNNIVLVEPD